MNVIQVVKTEIPLVELFFLGEHIANVLRDHIKLALVWDGENHNRFLQKVATNRRALIRTFESDENAKVWLIHDREDEPFLDLNPKSTIVLYIKINSGQILIIINKV